MKEMKPDQPCYICRKPNLVFHPDDKCVPCQEVDHRMWLDLRENRIGGKLNAGWRRMVGGGNMKGCIK